MSLLRPALGWQEVRVVRTEMRRLGATSPATAKPQSELPDFVQSDLARYVEIGVLRPSVPGTYFLSEARVSTVIRVHILKAVTFWFLVIIIPVVILQLSNSRAPTP
jgi:hypothetical protein